MTRYLIVRHSDDTGNEAIVETEPITRLYLAKRRAADLNRAAAAAGAAVTYRLLHSVHVSRHERDHRS